MCYGEVRNGLVFKEKRKRTERRDDVQLNAPVAQLDRALPSEGKGHTFESCRVRQYYQGFPQLCALPETIGVTVVSLAISDWRAALASLFGNLNSSARDVPAEFVQPSIAGIHWMAWHVRFVRNAGLHSATDARTRSG